MENQQTLPDWFDKNFLQQALGSFHNDKTIEIVDFEPSKSFGEHFGSSMLQCKIFYKSSKLPKAQELDVVIKAMVPEGSLEGDIAGGPIFDTEIKMYKEVIPAMEQLFERSGLKFELAPR
jgi:hypothetical protein